MRAETPGRDFDWFVLHIRARGYRAEYRGRRYTYLDVDGRRYWTMEGPRLGDDDDQSRRSRVAGLRAGRTPRRRAGRWVSRLSRRWQPLRILVSMEPRRTFQVEDEEIDATTHMIKLGGEVDFYTAPEFKERLLELLASGKKQIVVDLDQAIMIDDSPILRVITETVGSGGDSVALVCAAESVRRVFAITGLDQVFPIYGTRDEALTAFGLASQSSPDERHGLVRDGSTPGT